MRESHSAASIADHRNGDCYCRFDDPTHGGAIEPECPCSGDAFPADWDGRDEPCVTCGHKASEDGPLPLPPVTVGTWAEFEAWDGGDEPTVPREPEWVTRARESRLVAKDMTR